MDGYQTEQYDFFMLASQQRRNWIGAFRNKPRCRKARLSSGASQNARLDHATSTKAIIVRRGRIDVADRCYPCDGLPARSLPKKQRSASNKREP
jgi:hypothetical protein